MQSTKKPASPALMAADTALRRAILKVKDEAAKNGKSVIALGNDLREKVSTRVEQEDLNWKSN